MTRAEKTARAAVVRAPSDTRQRVLVEAVRPSVAGGKYPAKRVVGDDVVVTADLVADSHDVVRGRVLYRRAGDGDWQSALLTAGVNDRHAGRFRVDALGRWEFVVEGWVDEFASWRRALERKIEGGEAADVISHLRQGAQLVAAIAARGPAQSRQRWIDAAKTLDAADANVTAAQSVALDAELGELAAAYPDSSKASRSDVVFEIDVERPRAAFSSWYEFFPRSCGPDGRHGSFRDCEERLGYVAEMGFDVVYLPPIHPIGRSFRKGRNNTLVAEPDDPGSPWAIGAAEGGHKSVHPELGTLEDFRWFLKRTHDLGMEVALDIALQVSPDHPYVSAHPQWFIRRPDGSIQYAENPPKKYQDIYPFDFQCEDADALWRELTSIFQFWIEQGVRIFRVDNPHTKSLPFWRYCIGELKREHPDVIFLAEAFTRPKLMYALAKLGFSQSYTYFTWRNTKHELTEYFTELTRSEVAEFFRPNLWPNTPDILPEHLQFGGRPAFVSRLVLAATLGSNYGIYGPAFELLESTARPASGEYVDNEKYELKSWAVGRADSLRPLIRKMNAIRRENPALHAMDSLHFHPTDNDMLICYSKQVEGDAVLVVVNLDPHFKQSGFLDLDLAALGLPDPSAAFQVHDLLGGGRFLWSGGRNYVELDPHSSPAHVFRLRYHLRTEHDFDYFA